MKDNQKDKLLKYREGDLITYKAKLTRLGDILGLSATDGELIEEAQAPSEKESQIEEVAPDVTGNMIKEIVQEVKQNANEFKFDPDSVVHKDNDISLSLDKVEYEIKGEDYAKINSITISILNEGNEGIEPTLLVYLYDDNDKSEDKFRVKDEIDLDVGFFGLDPGEHATQKLKVSIPFDDIDLTKTFRLTLTDRFSYPTKAYVSVDKEIKVNG